MTLYLAGPMSGIEEHNYPAFRAAAQRLREAGYDVRSPAEHDIAISGQPWDFWMRRALRQMLLCDGVATLPGWQASRGACLEVEVAYRLRMTVQPLAVWLEGQ